MANSTNIRVNSSGSTPNMAVFNDIAVYLRSISESLADISEIMMRKNIQEIKESKQRIRESIARNPETAKVALKNRNPDREVTEILNG